VVARPRIWKLFNNLYDSRQIFEQPFIQTLYQFFNFSHSTFDVGRSMFDVHYWILVHLCGFAVIRVSFPIKLAASAACG
jgi:hypothetical protein